MSDKTKWLDETKEYLANNDGEDLYYLMFTMLNEEKMSFIKFLLDASKGIGCVVHEGLEYVLDQDLDYPEDFDLVTFYVGEFESSEITPNQFVMLMQYVSDAYIKAFPDSKDTVERHMKALTERYA
ncbi:hypothetical protein [Xenorhabdus anantnagensis]|uniref:CDI immunity protein domain-containing protein n=1 Tax=Xenorhabdus anantnagensis TaxID=3025875 RepID=A0ABT5LTN4_9GAMM|nr:hypothetical protein [Xenorhabdus anantnagensis]MDC9597787.1 hypothetical protein [Xenorhabdus anantnagensis]